MIFDSLFVIRSVGERTEELCKKLVLDQGVSEKQIVVVCEVPFSKSMRKSFQLGIESGYKYTFCIDADVLLRPKSINYLINEFDKLSYNICEIQGLVIDKFFGGPRAAGNHLYRTSLLNKVINLIPEEGIDIRPETYTLEAMSKEGYPWISIPFIVGLHDYEQYNIDIYRKCFVQGVKHLNFTELFIKNWKQNAENDSDYKIALTAFADSIVSIEPLFINSRQKVYSQGFNNSGFIEKSPITQNEYSLEEIEQFIILFKDFDEYNRFFPDRAGLKINIYENLEKIEQKSFIVKLKYNLEKKGLFKLLLFLTGKLMIKIGRQILDRIS